MEQCKIPTKQRVGRVTIYLRGKIWYLYYCENGRRVRRRVGVLLADAKRLAAQANGQLALGLIDDTGNCCAHYTCLAAADSGFTHKALLDGKFRNKKL